MARGAMPWNRRRLRVEQLVSGPASSSGLGRGEEIPLRATERFGELFSAVLPYTLPFLTFKEP